MQNRWKDYHFIFDLEECVDSRHRSLSVSDEQPPDRQLYDPAPHLVFKDRLKAPVTIWKRVKCAGDAQITVLTTKQMDDAQSAFLEFHGLPYDRMMSRSESDVSSDAKLRERQLDELASDIGIAREALVFCECGAQIMVADFSQLPGQIDKE